jgi:hypothetical protein
MARLRALLRYAGSALGATYSLLRATRLPNTIDVRGVGLDAVLQLAVVVIGLYVSFRFGYGRARRDDHVFLYVFGLIAVAQVMFLPSASALWLVLPPAAFSCALASRLLARQAT